jgi:SMC interacting uncharacterized protein involved in chromosome segregation
MLSQSPRAVVARERKERKDVIDLEEYRKAMREKIAKYGPDYSKWPESQSKLKSEIEDMEHELSH